jgi:hypothetical protein
MHFEGSGGAFYSQRFYDALRFTFIDDLTMISGLFLLQCEFLIDPHAFMKFPSVIKAKSISLLPER